MTAAKLIVIIFMTLMITVTHGKKSAAKTDGTNSIETEAIVTNGKVKEPRYNKYEAGEW